MKTIGKVLISPLGNLIGAVLPHAPKPPAPLPVVTRDDAATNSSLADELARRRGGAADMLNGSGGAEAGSTGKTQLG